MQQNFYSRILHLAWPLILCNISVPLLGMVNTGLMGHLSHAYYLGAVGVATIIFDFLYWGFGFLRMGTTGMIAQALGKNNDLAVRRTFLQSLSIALFFAALLIVLQAPLIKLALYFIEPSTKVAEYSQIYFHVAIWGAPATLANYVLLGWFIAMQKPRYTLVMQISMNGVGILLALLFVLKLSLKVKGVAMAMLIAQYCGFSIGLMGALHLLNRFKVNVGWRDLLHWPSLREIFQVNRDIFIRTLCLIFSMAFFTSQGARLGKIVLAANVVLMNFQMFMAFALDAFANAAEALVGNAFGARNKTQFLAIIKAAAVCSLIIAGSFSLIYLIFGAKIIYLLTGILDVRSTALTYLPWLIVLPLISVWSFLWDGVFIGATQASSMRNTMLLSMLFFLLMWYFTRDLANHGLWLAFTGFITMRAVSMSLVFYIKLYRNF